MIKPNIFATRSEIKRAVWMCKERQPYCRYGQAFLNCFPEYDKAGLDIYEIDNYDAVVQAIFEFQFG